MGKQKKANTSEDAFYRSQSFLDTILNSITDGVFTVDNDWHITSFNDAAERITGVPREDALGKHCYDVFHANICQECCALKKTIITGTPSVNERVDIINAEGEKVPVSISTAILKDDADNIIGGVETFRDMSQVEQLKKEVLEKYTFEDIISKNHEILKIFNILPDIAQSNSTVLVQGPSGSGKELIAKAIHNLSPRANAPLVVVNCAALPENLLESELFGYVKGAFTDARSDKPGKFALADGGTIFLDEIGELPLSLQVKLLRVLQEKRFEPLGSVKSMHADVRIIAATNKNLAKMVKAGQFREDLFYRINVIKIELPPLRDRKEDIPLLVEHFIHKFNVKMGKNVQYISDDVMDILMQHDYPGNIRELENIIEHAFILCHSDTIEARHLPPELAGSIEELPRELPQISDPRARAEAKLIIETLSKNGGNRVRTARELNIDPSTLWRKMKKYNIS